MSNQVDGVIELKPEKSESKAEKAAKVTADKPAAEKSAKEKPAKDKAPKAPKTAFSGRVEDVTVKGDGSITVSLKDKRGKAHEFPLSGNLASTITAQLLATAMSAKLKLHVNTAADNAKQVVSLSLHSKK